MTSDAKKNRKLGLSEADSQVIGFRLPKEIAAAVKIETKDRGIALNGLFVEMWELYQKDKRK